MNSLLENGGQLDLQGAYGLYLLKPGTKEPDANGCLVKQPYLKVWNHPTWQKNSVKTGVIKKTTQTMRC